MIRGVLRKDTYWRKTTGDKLRHAGLSLSIPFTHFLERIWKEKIKPPQKQKVPKSLGPLLKRLERETGFEPATFSLGS